jgi:hypothetical protein
MKRLKVLLVALVLSIFLVPSARAVDYGEILSAETRTGSIAYPAQTDSFTFNGEAGQTVVISWNSLRSYRNKQLSVTAIRYLYHCDQRQRGR